MPRREPGEVQFDTGTLSGRVIVQGRPQSSEDIRLNRRIMEERDRRLEASKGNGPTVIRKRRKQDDTF